MGVDVTESLLRLLAQGTTNAIFQAPGRCYLKESFPASRPAAPPPHGLRPSPRLLRVGVLELRSPGLVHVVCTSDPVSLKVTLKFGSIDTNSPSRRAQWLSPRAGRTIFWPGARCGIDTICSVTAPGPLWLRVTLPRLTRVYWGPPPHHSWALGRARSSSGHSCPPSPPCTLIAPWAGGRGAPGPCIIRGLNRPAARAGRRAGGGATDPVGVWPRGAGAPLSSPPALARVGERGGGWVSRKATPRGGFMQLFFWVSGTAHRVAAAGAGSCRSCSPGFREAS